MAFLVAVAMVEVDRTTQAKSQTSAILLQVRNIHISIHTRTATRRMTQINIRTLTSSVTLITMVKTTLTSHHLTNRTTTHIMVTRPPKAITMVGRIRATMVRTIKGTMMALIITSRRNLTMDHIAQPQLD